MGDLSKLQSYYRVCQLLLLALLLIGMITAVSVHAILTPPFDVLYVSSFYGGSYVKAMNGLMFFVMRSGVVHG